MAKVYASRKAIMTFTNVDDPEDKYTFTLANIGEQLGVSGIAALQLLMEAILPPFGKMRATKLQMQLISTLNTVTTPSEEGTDGATPETPAS
jgi:hypothetical protein